MAKRSASWNSLAFRSDIKNDGEKILLIRQSRRKNDTNSISKGKILSRISMKYVWNSTVDAVQ